MGTKKTDPSNVMQEMIQKEGMTATTKKVMKEISEAFFGPQGKQFPLPTWGRVKGWAEGSLAYYNSNVPAGPGVNSSTPTSPPSRSSSPPEVPSLARTPRAANCTHKESRPATRDVCDCFASAV